MSNSRIKGIHRLSVAERIAELRQLGWIDAADAELLLQGKHVLSPAAADKIIENVVAVYALPFAIAANFVINGRDTIVPMVVEEPSIVAATSNAARLARRSGGFTVECPESLLAGQVHVAGIVDVEKALSQLQQATPELLKLANAVHPRLAERGGGVRDIEIRRLDVANAKTVIAVHFLVDTSDAMGANLVNTICESVAPKVAELCGGQVALRILSNLADRALVTARVRYRLDDLATGDFDAATVRDGIVLASDIAVADPYRAATHNKGIMNGIDAIAIATGNDWRAIEAGAHAFAAATGRYLPLATWSVDDNGDLVGEIRIPLKVGIVGGTVAANSAAAVAIRMTGVESASELAELMAAAGLAQNFSALRALATHGIQDGHMRLHARSVASSANVPAALFDELVDELVAGGDIKIGKAREILAAKQQSWAAADPMPGTAAGKIILLGEHAVVYGKHALALPIRNAVSAGVTKSDGRAMISIPDWGISQAIGEDDCGVAAVVAVILTKLEIKESRYSIRLRSALPRAMGLGSSAALAVAIVRAFDAELDLGLDDARINAIAFECEKLAHGTPSGIDNTIATYGEPMLFSHAESLQIERLTLAEPPPIIIAYSHTPGITKEQVAKVRALRDRLGQHVDALFDEIDALSLAGAAALTKSDYEVLGELMNICQGLLNAIGVSTAELEGMVNIARAAGAAGAKLTGAGGGGSIVALCPNRVTEVSNAFQAAGFETLQLAN